MFWLQIFYFILTRCLPTTSILVFRYPINIGSSKCAVIGQIAFLSRGSQRVNIGNQILETGKVHGHLWVRFTPGDNNAQQLYIKINN